MISEINENILNIKESNMVWVFKNGKLMRRNETDAREFKTIEKARNFVMNLIWVSNKLTPADFTYMIG